MRDGYFEITRFGNKQLQCKTCAKIMDNSNNSRFWGRYNGLLFAQLNYKRYLKRHQDKHRRDET